VYNNSEKDSLFFFSPSALADRKVLSRFRIKYEKINRLNNFVDLPTATHLSIPQKYKGVHKTENNSTGQYTQAVTLKT
jgi:hypothetical protein